MIAPCTGPCPCPLFLGFATVHLLYA
jgi:hypothetical protein